MQYGPLLDETMQYVITVQCSDAKKSIVAFRPFGHTCHYGTLFHS